MKQGSLNNVHAPEIYGDFWFNSEPLTVHAMHGQVILLCFWDFTSEASLQLLNHVREWHRRYEEMGLVVIGIHSPEFSFARNAKLIESVVQRLGLVFPVTTDNTLMMREAYRIQELPALCLIDRDGGIYFSHAGDGAHERTERAIQALLREAGYHGELPLLAEFSQADENPSTGSRRPTPAIQTGYLHGSLGNVEGYSPELPALYNDAHFYVEGKFYAEGTWLAKSDAFEYRGGANEGYLTARYAGSTVNVVIGSEREGTLVRVLRDGKRITRPEFGEDLSVDDLGNTVIVVREPKLFHLIRSTEFGEHTVTLVPLEEGITVYSFTFGSSRPSPIDASGKTSYRNN